MSLLEASSFLCADEVQTCIKSMQDIAMVTKDVPVLLSEGRNGKGTSFAPLWRQACSYGKLLNA